MLYEFKGHRPSVDPSAFVHPQAAVTGNVTIGRNVYIGPGAAIRGDWGGIVIEDGCNVQENCTIHMFPGVVVRLKEGAHIGHGAIVHGAQIGRNCLIGMNSVIMDNAEIGDECIVGAMSFIKEGEKIPGRSVVVGNPAKIVKAVSDDMLQWKTAGTAIYQALPEEMRKYWRPAEEGEQIPSAPEESEAPETKKYNYRPWKDIQDSIVNDPRAAYREEHYGVSITIEEYFDLERNSGLKLEYCNGLVVVMAGAKWDHNIICTNLQSSLKPQLKGTPCKVTGGEMRVFVEKENLFTYPDALIVCGKREFRENDELNLMNPSVLFEVLSPSTSDYDRELKFERYKQLSTFREYILIDSKRVLVEHFVKDTEGVWQSQRIMSLEEELLIKTTGTRLSLKEIYEETQFPKLTHS